MTKRTTRCNRYENTLDTPPSLLYAAESSPETDLQDVDWHPVHDYMFGSVGDDKKLMM